MAGNSVTKETIDREVHGQTVVSRFLATVAAHPDHVAFHWKEKEGDEWAELVFAGYAREVARAMVGLQRLGVRRGDRVVLMMRNVPEFHVADMAVLFCGATPISIYNSSSPEQIRHLLGHSAAKVAVVEDAGFLARVVAVRADLPALQKVVVIDAPDELTQDGLSTWEEIIDNEPGDLTEAAARVRPKDIATIVYTSGTTGPPKGVMLSHNNVVWTCESYIHLLDIDPLGFRSVSYLPMAHIAERLTTHYLSVVHGYQVTTCPDPELLGTYLEKARPHIFFGVPRVWEKLRAAVLAALAADPKRKRKFDRAMIAAKPLVQARLDRDLTESEQHTLATLDRRVFRPVRDLLGLDTAEIAVTGAAPMPVELLEWFLAIGVPISELYGMSETTAALTWEPYRIRPGTVGRALPGVTLELAEDGEVLTKGGNVFPGYLDEPEKTAEVIDPDGWLHTGDIGELDDDGYLRIVDRKKELIITAGGDNVSPANLEAALRTLPLVGQACAVGDKRPFVAALVVLDPEAARAWAMRQGIAFSALSELAKHPGVREEIESGLEDAMADFNHPERVTKVAILAEEWQPDSDELTATSKIKRRSINVKYAREIEGLYD
jgi:long-subunit acyl-CoA synthetase (AMP-forming)